MTILERTLEMLEDRKGQWRQIATAAKLDYSWVAKLAQGHIKNPGIKNLQRLHDYLAERNRSR